MFLLASCVEEDQFYSGDVLSTFNVAGLDFEFECGNVCLSIPECVGWMVTKQLKECKLFQTLLDSVYAGPGFLSGRRDCSGKGSYD